MTFNVDLVITFRLISLANIIIANAFFKYFLSCQFYMEPKTKLAEEAQKQGLKKDDFITVYHGEIKVIGSENQE